MKENLQKKIAQYQQTKKVKSSFEGFINQKKKKMQELIQLDQDDLSQEKQNEYTTEKYHKLIDLKQQQYFTQMQQLQNLKLKVIQAKSSLENMKIQSTFQNKNLQHLTKEYQKQKLQSQNLINTIASKHERQIKDIIKVYDDRMKKNLEHYEQLLSQKAQQNQRRLEFVKKKKTFQQNMKKSKQTFTDELSKNKDNWAQNQKQIRQKWELKKKQQILQNTLRGIQPQIQRIVGSSKAQIKRIQEIFSIKRQQFRNQRVAQYQRKASEMRAESFNNLQAQKYKILGQYEQKIKNQYQTLDKQFQQDRKKIRAQREQEIKLLQQKRKKQTEQFFNTDKDFFVNHVNQLKSMQEEYEIVIKQLDGAFQLQIQKQQNIIRNKYMQSAKKYRELQEKQLLKKMKQFTLNYQKKIQNLKEDLAESVAVQNQVHETNLRKKNQLRIHQYRQNHENQLKNLRKNKYTIQTKISNCTQKYQQIKKIRQQQEEAYQEIKRQNQYQKKKLTELTLQLRDRKLASDGKNSNQKFQLQKVQSQWNEQIQSLKNNYINLQKQIQSQEEIMEQKKKQTEQQYRQILDQLAANSTKIINLKNNQIVKFKLQKQNLIKYGKSLDQMQIRQKEMIKKYKSSNKN